MVSLIYVVKVLGIIVAAPLAGGLLAGADRIISARMQSRKGPPLFQPFYDVLKLLGKDSIVVSPLTRYFVAFSLVFTIFTVVIFYTGGNFLFSIFSFTLACVFFVLAGYSSYSPYSIVGAERELLQIMCYEPMMLIVAFCYYKASGSFLISDAFYLKYPLITKMPFAFLGLTYILTIKLRKSPFDLSMSHHGHQEIVKGITTEFTGPTLAMVEISHWYETVFALGIVYVFFVNTSIVSYVLALLVTLVVYFLEIIIDNGFARVRWQMALKASWLATFIFGGANLLLLCIVN